MQIVYQPCATGKNWLGHHATRFSRKVYMSQEAAENGIPDFLGRLKRQHDHDMGNLETIDEVKIIELEFMCH